MKLHTIFLLLMLASKFPNGSTGGTREYDDYVNDYVDDENSRKETEQKSAWEIMQELKETIPCTASSCPEGQYCNSERACAAGCDFNSACPLEHVCSFMSGYPGVCRELKCEPKCLFGTCARGKCVCQPGFAGKRCQLSEYRYRSKRNHGCKSNYGTIHSTFSAAVAYCNSHSNCKCIDRHKSKQKYYAYDVTSQVSNVHYDSWLKSGLTNN